LRQHEELPEGDPGSGRRHLRLHGAVPARHGRRRDRRRHRVSRLRSPRPVREDRWSADHERAVRLGDRQGASRFRAVREQRARRHSRRRHVAGVVREMVEAAGRGAAAAAGEVRARVVTNTPVLGPPPDAPGTLTAPAPAKDVLTYLDQLGRWVVALRVALDNLDACAQVAQDPGAYTQDIVLAMSLWNSIDARRRELETTWDSGRVLENELAQIATLIWGRIR